MKQNCDQEELLMGIVGAGGFAKFAAAAFGNISGLKIYSIMDTDKSRAEEFANMLQVSAFTDYDALLSDDHLSVIYIATPPFLHYEQTRKALLAGKHVICEKPAALHAYQAKELAILAEEMGLLYTVNLMQRYNPLYDIVKKIIDEKLLGGFLHGFFENYASNENLGFGHWFWDTRKSGGIFIEHGVHFFDLFSGWLGKGEVIHAVQMHASGDHSVLTDRVQAVVLYENGFVNFFHGFNQLDVLDRQEMRLQFERGDITLYGWVPTKLKVIGFLSENEEIEFKSVLSNYVLSSMGKENFISKNRPTVEGYKIEAVYHDKLDKQERYSEMLREMMEDQLAWIRDKIHRRRINQENAVQSLIIAEQATIISKIV